MVDRHISFIKGDFENVYISNQVATFLNSLDVSGYPPSAMLQTKVLPASLLLVVP